MHIVKQRCIISWILWKTNSINLLEKLNNFLYFSRIIFGIFFRIFIIIRPSFRVWWFFRLNFFRIMWLSRFKLIIGTIWIWLFIWNLIFLRLLSNRSYSLGHYWEEIVWVILSNFFSFFFSFFFCFFFCFFIVLVFLIILILFVLFILLIILIVLITLITLIFTIYIIMILKSPNHNFNCNYNLLIFILFEHWQEEVYFNFRFDHYY